MGLFKIMHDFIGINANKLKGELREQSQKMKDVKQRLQNSEKCKKLRVKNYRL